MGRQKKATDPVEVERRMERAEFAEKYQALYRRLWLVAASILGDRSEADDVVQEAAIVAFQKRSEFRPGSNFSAWLTEIVKRFAANHKRKMVGRRTHPTDPRSLDHERSQPRAGDGVDTSHKWSNCRDQFDDDMLRALEKLSIDARCCLLLRVVDRLSYAEISSYLGIPEGTAMSHVHRSKQLMRRQLAASGPSRKEVDG
jgi:RNA polymerase sigma-70 factor (ECF subfamily)